MYTSIGETLKSERRARQYNLDFIVERINVPLRALEWIEESNFKAIGSRLYFLRYVRAYTEFMGISYESVESDCEREWELYTLKRARALGIRNGWEVQWSRFSFRYGFMALVLGISFVIAGYLSYQLKFLLGNPRLVLESPSLLATYTVLPFIDIAGNAYDDIRLSINQRPVSVTDRAFQERLYLSPGLNTIKITATNLRGSQTEDVRYVVYTPLINN